MRALLLLALLPLAGCALVKPPGPQAVLPHADEPWRALATEDDHQRLRDWRDSFVAGLDAAKKAGGGGDVAREGALLDPDAALPEAAPPAGGYRCRVLKVGRQDSQPPGVVAYPAVPCRIGAEARTMTFQMLAGPQRPVGRLFTETNRRMVFLGTLQVGDERGTLRYGDDEQRDAAGFLERIGDRRWRLLFPRPHFESDLDVVELVPAG
jgi:hypothetical protein